MKEKKKLIYGIVVLIICVIGISYAYWIFNYEQTGVNQLASSCFSLALTNETNEINLQKQYPISDEAGMKLVPFQFRVENTCDIFASYTVSLELLEGSTLGSQYIKTQLNREAPIKLSNTELGTTSITSSVESRILARGSLGSGDKEDYTLRLWMDKDVALTDVDAMNKVLLAKIVINAQPSTYSPVEQGITKLSDAMLANEYQTTVEQAKAKITAKGTPDFSQMAPISETDISDKGLYQADDDLGTSYYYRGSVNNNFVKFAGYYWRIIRRNGDGSVRLIYNGDKPDQIGDHTQIGTSAFNPQKDNPVYAGYMYGTVLNTSYDQTHANENSSTMKTFLEEWYKTNISDKEYHQYVADEIFCNDRSVTMGNGYTTNVISYFGPLKRLMQSKTPTLICPQENDKFTTTEAVVGNKALIYPIGLITADEVSMAGAAGKRNGLFYLYTGQAYWTMSPSHFYPGDSSTSRWYFGGSGYFSYAYATDVSGARPVLNLKSDVEITGGIGTANDPFVVG